MAEMKSAEAVAETEPVGTSENEASGVELQRQLDEAKQNADRYFQNWQRAQADFSNFKRRADQERQDATKRAADEFAFAVLPVLDDLERAFLTVPPELLKLTWIHGIHLIDRKLRFVLEAHGLTEIASASEPFDPTRHEAVLQEEVEPEREGQVLAIFQRGYQSGDRLLRPALVKVGVPRAAKESESG